MKKNFGILGLLLISSLANAAGVPTSFTYQGKALNAAGTAPLTSTVSFTLSITDPSSACILYQESQTNVNLATTNGIFALQVGSAVGATKRVSGTDPGLSMTTVFANAGTQLVASNGSCPGYTPASNDVRKLHVVITPSSGSPITVSPDLTINAVPNAMVAETLQGFALSQVLPAGMTMTFGGATCPTGFLAADGTSYSKTTYPTLFTAIGYTNGGSGTNFNVPDYRGIFLRGVDNMGTAAGAAGRDVDGRSAMNTGGNASGIGSIQADALQNHTHNFLSNGQRIRIVDVDDVIGGSGYNAYPGGPYYANDISSTGSLATGNSGSETRPKNAAVLYCIKY